MDFDMEERVRNRAYEIWECEGRPHGRDFEHWDQALREFAISACSVTASIELNTAAVGEAHIPAAAPKTRIAKGKTPAKPPRQSAKSRQVTIN